MQFFTGDWLKDPAVSLCSATTRGIWFDFLCAMHERDRSGVIAGTREALARLGRCSAVHLDHALSELQTSGAADVTERDGIVTVINRRMQRDAKSRHGNNERQRRHRRNGSVAPWSHPPSYSPSSSSSNNPPPPPNTSSIDDVTKRELEEEVFKCGVGDARNAVCAAIGSGCTAADIRGVIEGWTRRRADVGSGYLHWRLVNMRPGQVPDEGWPNPRPQPAGQAKREQQIQADSQDALANQIIKDMLKDGRSDDEIRSALAEKGLRWP